MIIAFIVSVLCVIIDQLTKFWLYGKSMSLIGDLLWLEPGFNTGASFSIFSNATIWLIIFSIPVMAFMVYAIISDKLSTSKFFKIAVAFVLGGTVGNFIDRVCFGGVRDFIYLKSINFAIFNVADVFINIGAYMLIGYVFYVFIKEYKANKAKKKEACEQGENHKDNSVGEDTKEEPVTEDKPQESKDINSNINKEENK